MKKKIEFGIVGFLMVLGFLMVFSIEPATAQNQNKQQDKNQFNFSHHDLNGDGVITQNEYQYGPIGQFDRNRDGQLTRKEFRKMSKAQNRIKDGSGNAVKQQKRLKDGSGAGKQQMKKNKNEGNNRSGSIGSQRSNFGNNSGLHRAVSPNRRGRG